MPVRRSLIALVAVTLTACQAAPAAPLEGRTTAIAKAVAKPAGKPVAAPLTDQAPTPAAYSHAAATALFRAAKYPAGEALCQQAVAAIERTEGANATALADQTTP
mgnify:FL=1